MAVDYSSANNKMESWSDTTRDLLVAELLKLGIKHRFNSQSPRAAVQSLSDRLYQRNGIVNRISFKFPRHLIFVHKGVGRGTPISRVGQTGRQPKEWFNPVIDHRIEQLADIVAEDIGSAILNSLTIR
ncbi:hypothetical protein QEG73_21915 [Chitinophagaceae bacterium 26-R-25]|nr:hypothetical protein [Chitinophagaceae bacterium 26-R-25]